MQTRTRTQTPKKKGVFSAFVGGHGTPLDQTQLRLEAATASQWVTSPVAETDEASALSRVNPSHARTAGSPSPVAPAPPQTATTTTTTAAAAAAAPLHREGADIDSVSSLNKSSPHHLQNAVFANLTPFYSFAPLQPTAGERGGGGGAGGYPSGQLSEGGTNDSPHFLNAAPTHLMQYQQQQQRGSREEVAVFGPSPTASSRSSTSQLTSVSHSQHFIPATAVELKPERRGDAKLNVAPLMATADLLNSADTRSFVTPVYGHRYRYRRYQSQDEATRSEGSTNQWGKGGQEDDGKGGAEKGGLAEAFLPLSLTESKRTRVLHAAYLQELDNTRSVSANASRHRLSSAALMSLLSKLDTSTASPSEQLAHLSRSVGPLVVASVCGGDGEWWSRKEGESASFSEAKLPRNRRRRLRPLSYEEAVKLAEHVKFIRSAAAKSGNRSSQASLTHSFPRPFQQRPFAQQHPASAPARSVGGRAGPLAASKVTATTATTPTATTPTAGRATTLSPVSSRIISPSKRGMARRGTTTNNNASKDAGERAPFVEEEEWMPIAHAAFAELSSTGSGSPCVGAGAGAGAGGQGGRPSTARAIPILKLLELISLFQLKVDLAPFHGIEVDRELNGTIAFDEFIWMLRSAFSADPKSVHLRLHSSKPPPPPSQDNAVVAAAAALTGEPSAVLGSSLPLFLSNALTPGPGDSSENSNSVLCRPSSARDGRTPSRASSVLSASSYVGTPSQRATDDEYPAVSASSACASLCRLMRRAAKALAEQTHGRRKTSNPASLKDNLTVQPTSALTPSPPSQHPQQGGRAGRPSPSQPPRQQQQPAVPTPVVVRRTGNRRLHALIRLSPYYTPSTASPTAEPPGGKPRAASAHQPSPPPSRESALCGEAASSLATRRRGVRTSQEALRLLTKPWSARAVDDGTSNGSDPQRRQPYPTVPPPPPPPPPPQRRQKSSRGQPCRRRSPCRGGCGDGARQLWQEQRPPQEHGKGQGWRPRTNQEALHALEQQKAALEYLLQGSEDDHDATLGAMLRNALRGERQRMELSLFAALALREHPELAKVILMEAAKGSCGSVPQRGPNDHDNAGASESKVAARDKSGHELSPSEDSHKPRPSKEVLSHGTQTSRPSTTTPSGAVMDESATSLQLPDGASVLLSAAGKGLDAVRTTAATTATVAAAAASSHTQQAEPPANPQPEPQSLLQSRLLSTGGESALSVLSRGLATSNSLSDEESVGKRGHTADKECQDSKAMECARAIVSLLSKGEVKRLASLLSSMQRDEPLARSVPPQSPGESGRFSSGHSQAERTDTAPADRPLSHNSKDEGRTNHDSRDLLTLELQSSPLHSPASSQRSPSLSYPARTAGRPQLQESPSFSSSQQMQSHGTPHGEGRSDGILKGLHAAGDSATSQANAPADRKPSRRQTRSTIVSDAGFGGVSLGNGSFASEKGQSRRVGSMSKHEATLKPFQRSGNRHPGSYVVSNAGESTRNRTISMLRFGSMDHMANISHATSSYRSHTHELSKYNASWGPVKPNHSMAERGFLASSTSPMEPENRSPSPNASGGLLSSFAINVAYPLLLADRSATEDDAPPGSWCPGSALSANGRPLTRTASRRQRRRGSGEKHPLSTPDHSKVEGSAAAAAAAAAWNAETAGVTQGGRNGNGEEGGAAGPSDSGAAPIAKPATASPIAPATTAGVPEATAAADNGRDDGGGDSSGPSFVSPNALGFPPVSDATSSISTPPLDCLLQSETPTTCMGQSGGTVTSVLFKSSDIPFRDDLGRAAGSTCNSHRISPRRNSSGGGGGGGDNGSSVGSGYLGFTKSRRQSPEFGVLSSPQSANIGPPSAPDNFTGVPWRESYLNEARASALEPAREAVGRRGGGSRVVPTLSEPRVEVESPTQASHLPVVVQILRAEQCDTTGCANATSGSIPATDSSLTQAGTNYSL